MTHDIPPPPPPPPPPPRYEEQPRTTDQIRLAFTGYPLSAEQVDRTAYLRDVGLYVAKQFAAQCPPSRELSLALTKLEEAVMHVVSGIARNEPFE